MSGERDGYRELFGAHPVWRTYASAVENSILGECLWMRGRQGEPVALFPATITEITNRSRKQPYCDALSAIFARCRHIPTIQIATVAESGQTLRMREQARMDGMARLQRERAEKPSGVQVPQTWQPRVKFTFGNENVEIALAVRTSPTPLTRSIRFDSHLTANIQGKAFWDYARDNPVNVVFSAVDECPQLTELCCRRSILYADLGRSWLLLRIYPEQ
ncbi:hypothetical protein HDV00_003379 [Rhizophlyctis rosea]|nr:hypothetical protein HDV00_003379 [Rhizophlyctis rosea]